MTRRGPWGLRVEDRGCGPSPSSSGGPQFRPNLVSVRLPPHPILLGSPPYQGGAWLNFGFYILYKCTPARIEATSHPSSNPNDDPSDRPMKRPGNRPSDRHADRPQNHPRQRPVDRPCDRPTERRPGLPTQLQTERSIHRASDVTTERAADHTPARSTGRSSY